MIIIPDKVAFIKVPKAASTTIARLFWDRHGVSQTSRLAPDVATTVRHFVNLDEVGKTVPVLNGNWFYNRSGAFGWHTGYADLMHIFGDQLDDFHWIASVRHPVARLFSVFSFQVAKKRIDASLTAEDFEAFCTRVFDGCKDMSQQQLVHTWPQTHWLPPEGVDCSIIRQESLADDLERLSNKVATFKDAKLSSINRSFKGAWQTYISPELSLKIEAFYSADMERFKYEPASVGDKRRVA